MSNRGARVNSTYHTGWQPGDQVTDTDRALALDRALIMSQLFRTEYFPEVVRIINGNKNETDFINLCEKAGLPDKEQWLWNYLQNYNKKQNWAGTGW